MSRITQQTVDVLQKFKRSVFTTDFSGYETGQPLIDWTDFWGVGSFTYLSQANTGTYKVGIKYCDYLVATDARAVLTWDTVGDVADSDIIVKVNGSTIESNAGIRIYSRVSGTSGSENCYFVEPRGNLTIAINKYVSGTASLLTTIPFYHVNNLDYYMRFQTIGTTIRAKIWAESSIEPDEWKISTTDSSLTTGHVGFGGFYGSVDYSVDYFSCGIDSNEPDFFPPVFYKDNPLDSFGSQGSQTVAQVSNATLAMGGPFGSENKVLTGARINLSTHATPIRIGIYSGGDLSTGLNNATLLYDFGEIASSTNPLILTIPKAERLGLIPKNTPLWIVLKSSGASFSSRRSNYSGNSGNFQIARGRTGVTSIIGYDTTVAFPTTFPNTSSTFSSPWYDWEILLEEAICEEVAFDRPSGEYPASTLLTLTTETVGATIWYSDNNLFPPQPGGPYSVEYTGPFAIASARTISAAAFKTDYYDSFVTSETYTVGGALVGDTLSTTDGVWAFNPTSITYQWKRDDVPIPGAISSTYLTVSADAGTAVKCTVTASNSEGSTPVDSNETNVSST